MTARHHWQSYHRQKIVHRRLPATDHEFSMERAQTFSNDVVSSKLVLDAIAQHLAYEHGEGRYPEPPLPARSAILNINGRWYVVMRDASLPVAVYRVVNDGKLTRLSRWPLIVGKR